jgi:uncharacterized RmlC-like cupin family protein
VGQTTQTTGMRRLEAISGKTVGAANLWMGQTHVPARTSSGNHHHGSSETAIYVVSGNPVFVFLDVDAAEPVERRIEASPGDYVFVPPFVPHREENPDPETEAIVVIARTTQEAIVVNLAELSWTEVTEIPGQGLPATCASFLTRPCGFPASGMPGTMSTRPQPSPGQRRSSTCVTPAPLRWHRRHR